MTGTDLPFPVRSGTHLALPRHHAGFVTSHPQGTIRMTEHMDAKQDRVKEAPMNLIDYFAFRRSVRLDRSLRTPGSGAVGSTARRTQRWSEDLDTEIAVAI